MSATAVAVLASGLVTPVGFRAEATLAALHAGISGVQTLGFRHAGSGEALRGGRVALSQRWTGTSLLAGLLAPAIGECLRAASVPVEEVPWLVGVSSAQRPGRPPDLDHSLLPEVAHRLGLRLPPHSATVARDAMGAAHALQVAMTLIQEGRARQVVIGGVDSFLEPRLLIDLDRRRRLLGPGRMDGFLPGEGAAAVLVSAADIPASDHRPGLLIRGLAFAQEEAPVGSGRPFRGEGLTVAVAAVLADTGLSMEDIAWRLSDVSGEHYGFKEAMLAAIRLDRARRDEALDLWHPIEYTGHLGAAVTPLLMAWAQHALELGYAPGPRALCHVGDDAGGRAAFVVEARAAGRLPWSADWLAHSLLDAGDVRKEYLS